jgi:hypothetical protein
MDKPFYIPSAEEVGPIIAEARPIVDMLATTFVAEGGAVSVLLVFQGSPDGRVVLKVDASRLGSLMMRFSELTHAHNAIAENRDLNPFATLRVHTSSFLAQVMGGNSTEGNVLLQLFSPEGAIVETHLGPFATAQLANGLQEALNSMPRAPAFPQMDKIIPGMSVPGEDRASKGTVAYFGQEYPVDVIQALGVLMVRANLLEQSLVELLCILGEMSKERAAAIFYSSSSAKARTSLIRALVEPAKLKSHGAKQVVKSLDRVDAVSGRRNNLVHAMWNFEEGKLKAALYKPNDVKPRKPVVTDAKAINELSADFRTAGMLVIAAASTIDNERRTSPEKPA